MKTNYNFTAQDVLDEVLKLAQERPDFVYLEQPDTLRLAQGFVTCSYVGAAGRRGQQVGEGCIVGQALQRLGVSTEDLVLVEGESADSAVRELLGQDHFYEERNLQVIRRIQARQDGGMPWGLAVTA